MEKYRVKQQPRRKRKYKIKARFFVILGIFLVCALFLLIVFGGNDNKGNYKQTMVTAEESDPLPAGVTEIKVEKPEGKVKVTEETIVDPERDPYAYKDTKQDIMALAKAYPDRLTAYIVGKTPDDRNLYALRLGSADAKRQIFVNASMHAREYINTQVVMQMIERYCRNYKSGKYKGTSYKKLFNQVAIWFMPLDNPDGVSISQYGLDGIKSKKLREKVAAMPLYGEYSNWKSNGVGVDLNRNWPIGRGVKQEYKEPAYSYYGGPEAESEEETKAIKRVLSMCGNLKAVLNYHSMGNLVYWGEPKGHKKEAREMAQMILDHTGYSSEHETGKGDGDFESYCRNYLKVPYACVETGWSVPVSHYEYSGIYDTVKELPEMVAYMFRNK